MRNKGVKASHCLLQRTLVRNKGVKASHYLLQRTLMRNKGVKASHYLLQRTLMQVSHSTPKLQTYYGKGKGEGSRSQK